MIAGDAAVGGGSKRIKIFSLWAAPQPNNGIHPTANSAALIVNLPLITVSRGG
jgi:hypothetical protein